jgi:DNA polymerase
MAEAFGELIDATIQHLESLKARGVRFVPITSRFESAPPQESARPSVGSVARPRQPLSEPAKPTRVMHPPSRATAIANPPAVVARPSSAKEAALSEIRMRALACLKCPHLASARKNVVFGVGNAEADLLFVGEAPGADEDIEGEPFVGRAGELLTKIIEAMGLSRERVYIANILKCRPDMPPGAPGNRKPTAEEMQTCIPFLHEQIDVIQPKLLVALGGTAVEGLLGPKEVGITRLRGNWQTYRGIPLMPTFHPSYVLRNQSASTKRQIWEDMLQVMERVGMPISDKQRRFFLPKG